jgi:hypothetical protein
MSTFVRDVVEPEITIGGKKWDVIDLKVELSRNRAPNFVSINKMVPREGIYFSQPEDLVGNSFELTVDTELESYRNAPGKYNSKLFEGNVANITAKGTGVYEAIIYDPSQQALNTGAKGSVLNQNITMSNPTIDYSRLSKATLKYASKGSETTYTADTVVYKASKALSQALDQTGVVEDRDIQLSKTGKVIGGGRGQFRGALDVFVTFDESDLTVGDVLSKIAKESKSFWWFDREGTFHFGVPDATVHYPELITDTSAGLTTPPYQSVKIIGSDVATSNGYSTGNLNPDEPLIMGADITIGSNAEPSIEGQKEIKYGEDPDLSEPTFVYRNQEIITKQQAQNALEKIGQDLGEQYASGKVTTSGFPEPQIFDVMVMPHANSEKKGKGNYRPRQPMGGSIFGIYKIVHKLNSSDGFKSQFHVAGMIAPASVITAPSDFLSNPEKRSSTEEEGTEFEGVKGPPTAKELKSQAKSNAVKELMNQGYAGTAEGVKQKAGDKSVIKVASNQGEKSAADQSTSQSSRSATVSDQELEQAPRGTRPDENNVGPIEGAIDDAGEAIGNAIDTVFGGVAEEGEQNPYTYR